MLQGGGTTDQVLAGILTLDEYYNRAGGTTNAFLNRLSQDLLGQAQGASGKFGQSGKSKASDLLNILRNLPRKDEE